MKGIYLLILTLSLAAASTVAVLLYPELLFNKKVFDWAFAPILQKSGFSWDFFEIHAQYLNVSRKSLQIQFENFCYQHSPVSEPAQVRICFQQAEAQGDLNFLNWIHPIDQVHSLNLRHGNLKVSFSTQNSDSNSGSRPSQELAVLPKIVLPSWLDKTTFNQIQVYIDHASLRNLSGQDFSGSLIFRSFIEKKTPSWELKLNAKALGTKKHRRNGHLDNKNIKTSSPFLTLSVQFKQQITSRHRGYPSANSRVAPRSDRDVLFPLTLDPISYQLKAQWRSGFQGEISSQGAITAIAQSDGFLLQKLQGRVSGKIHTQEAETRSEKRLAVWPSQVSFDACPIEIHSHSGIALDCLLDAKLAEPWTFFESKRSDHITGIKAQVSLQSNRTRHSFEPGIEAKIWPIIASPHRPLARLSAQISTRVSGFYQQFPSTWMGVPLEFPQSLTPLGRIRAQAELPEFQRVVQALEDTKWAVPAPFNALRGLMTLNVDGSASLERVHLNYSLKTALFSQLQRVLTQTRGGLDLKRTPHQDWVPELDLSTELTQVTLALPTIRFDSLPQLIPDSRFETTKKSSVLPFLIRWRIQTPQTKPLHLLSNVAQTEIPLELNVHWDSQQFLGNLTGHFRVGRFNLELFRRDATVENLDLDLLATQNSPTSVTVEHPLSGTIRVRYTDYEISVLLSGSLERPKVNLISDPPLPEDQLISALLFGQPLEGLDPEQSTSLGEARSALANGAVNLISLYLLASTPIQSIGFDPRTGVFTAKLRLSPGTSLNIGADPNELQEIGLQKRLGRYWTIVTQLSDPTTPERRALVAYLEWSHRY